MRVAIVSGPRSLQPMGLELAERHLLEAARAEPGLRLDVRVVGGRAARRYARAIGGRWHPGRPGRLPRRAWRAADVVHMIGLDVPPPRGGLFVATVQDLAALRFGDEGRLPQWTTEMVSRAGCVVTPSHFTAAELQERLGVAPHRIRVIPHGPGQAVSPATRPLPERDLQQFGLRTPLVLRMGGYTERKNVGIVLDAWPEVRKRTRATLALAGPPQPVREVQLAAAPSLDGVVALDYLPADIVPGLLRAATVLVSTSTYEGFGLPPLEAMTAGIPVVAVRSGAVEEVCGDAALLVDDDADALAEALVHVLEDQTLRARLVADGLQRASSFGWPQAAAALGSVYREFDRAEV